MTKKHTKQKFNEQSAPKADAGYADAGPKRRAKMDRAIKDIESEPHSFEAIITFGEKSLDAQAKVTGDLARLQGRFSRQVSQTSTMLEGLADSLSALGFDNFGEKVSDLVRRAYDGASAAGDKQLAADIQEALPVMVDGIDTIARKLAKTEKNLAELLADTQLLRDERDDVVRDLALNIDAGRHALGRYTDKFIPAAEKRLEERQDEESSDRLEDVRRRREDLVDRLTILEGAQATGTIAGQQLRRITEILEDHCKKMQDLQHTSVNEWKAMLTAAGIAIGSTPPQEPAKDVAQPAAPHQPMKPGPKP